MLRSSDDRKLDDTLMQSTEWLSWALDHFEGDSKRVRSSSVWPPQQQPPAGGRSRERWNDVLLWVLLGQTVVDLLTLLFGVALIVGGIFFFGAGSTSSTPEGSVVGGVVGFAATLVGAATVALGVVTVVPDILFALRARRGRISGQGLPVYEGLRAVFGLFTLWAIPLALYVVYGAGSRSSWLEPVGALVSTTLPLTALIVLVAGGQPSSKRRRFLGVGLLAAALLLVETAVSATFLAGEHQNQQNLAHQARSLLPSCAPGGVLVDLAFSGALAGHVSELCGPGSVNSIGRSPCLVNTIKGRLAGDYAMLHFQLKGILYVLEVSLVPTQQANGPLPFEFPVVADVAPAVVGGANLQPLGSASVKVSDGFRDGELWAPAVNGTVRFEAEDNGIVDVGIGSVPSAFNPRGGLFVKGSWRCTGVEPLRGLAGP
jgi:hypothetical protein